jgi:polysaccharide biosynthesis/export protein
MNQIHPPKTVTNISFITACSRLISASLVMWLIFLSGCAGGGASNSAMTGGTAGTLSAPPMSKVDPYKENDLLRVGDSIIIRLSGVPDQEQGTYESKVDEGGQISMPHIGGVPAAGLTTVQLKEKIETLYKLQKIYNNPNITILTQQARFVSVTGEVRAPQRLFHSKDLTALGAIASCGGFTDYANRRRVRVLRGSQVIEFNALEALGDPSKDIPLIPDDKIQVDRSIF